MRSRPLSRFALSACAATVMLGGCGGSQPPLATTGGMPLGRASSSSGYNTLYSFGKRPSDGQQPKAALIDVNGTLYGTTFYGGRMGCIDGCGTVFKIKPSGKETVVYRFTGGPDGANPSASLLAVKGVLYGTTEYGGGAANYGTVFEVSTSGAEKVLHGFQGWYSQYRYDGANPVASLINVNGKLYGTTSSGGNARFYGTVFRVTTSGREKVLYNFQSFGVGDGANPVATLVNVGGTLYGTTEDGGQYVYNQLSSGTVFSVSTTGVEKVLYAFLPEPYSSNGGIPKAGLINVDGTLFGTTAHDGPYGYAGGTAFSITTSGSLTNLDSFGSGDDGSGPVAPLLNVRNSLYGTTASGGAYGNGTVFKMSLGGKEKVLHSFGYGSDGATPLAGLIDINGTLYGTTSAGGTYGDGTVFALKP